MSLIVQLFVQKSGFMKLRTNCYVLNAKDITDRTLSWIGNLTGKNLADRPSVDHFKVMEVDI